MKFKLLSLVKALVYFSIFSDRAKKPTSLPEVFVILNHLLEVSNVAVLSLPRSLVVRQISPLTQVPSTAIPTLPEMHTQKHKACILSVQKKETQQQQKILFKIKQTTKQALKNHFYYQNFQGPFPQRRNMKQNTSHWSASTNVKLAYFQH